MLNLDTHMVIHALAGSLQPSEQELLAGARWGISAIVLWEIAKLAQLGRISIDPSDPDVALTLNNLHVWPLDLDVAVASTRLDFRGDPADEIIAATSVVHGIPLVTRDQRIRRSKMVPLSITT